MARIVTVAAAQLGPIARADSRAQAVARLIALMRQAASHGCDLVVFPECALTAFFPHWYFERQADIDAYFEREMPSAATQPLFDCARELPRVAADDGDAHHPHLAKGSFLIHRSRAPECAGSRDTCS